MTCVGGPSYPSGISDVALDAALRDELADVREGLNKIRGVASDTEYTPTPNNVRPNPHARDVRSGGNYKVESLSPTVENDLVDTRHQLTQSYHREEVHDRLLVFLGPLAQKLAGKRYVVLMVTHSRPRKIEVVMIPAVPSVSTFRLSAESGMVNTARSSCTSSTAFSQDFLSP